MATIEGKAKELFDKAEVVAICTCGGDGLHMVATWGDFVRTIGIQDGNKIVIPAGGYQVTEENLKSDSRVQVLIGSNQVQGTNGMGFGCRLSGSGEIQTSGELYDLAKSKFPWARGTFVIHVDKIEYML